MLVLTFKRAVANVSITSSQAGATRGADLERLQSHSQTFGDSACVPVLYLHIKFLTQKTALSGCPLCCNNRGILCSVGCSPVIPPSTCFLSLAAPLLLCPLPRPSAGLSASHTPALAVCAPCLCSAPKGLWAPYFSVAGLRCGHKPAYVPLRPIKDRSRFTWPLSFSDSFYQILQSCD